MDLQVYDLYGREVIRRTLQGGAVYELDTEALSAGAYLVVLRARSGKIWRTKVMKH